MATGSCIAISATIYAERSGSVGVIISILSSVMGVLMVEIPQSIPTAPSMQRHTMRVVLVINVNLNLRDKDLHRTLWRSLKLPYDFLSDTKALYPLLIAFVSRIRLDFALSFAGFWLGVVSLPLQSLYHCSNKFLFRRIYWYIDSIN